MPFEIRDVADLAGCRAVVDVQIEVWGRDAETVPASLLVASIKRGGILIGVWEGPRLVGFVWSMPGTRDGRPTHWSHMLGVRPEARGLGLGLALKCVQGQRALAAGFDLIEWTFDPLQATNAHLNMSSLGCVASEYRVNTYGEMPGPLHRGTPTDRLVAEWWPRETAAGNPRAALENAEARPTILTRPSGTWTEIAAVRTDLDAPELCIAVPARFGEMQHQATEIALAWRMATREAFTAYFARGYQAVGFTIDRENGGGTYVLSRRP
jgi:predicted GNAT superfamily acetyltransferase